MTLHSDTQDILEFHFDGYTQNDAEAWIDDLEQHGCVSGMVSDLIYYHDTIKFFDANEDEILDLAKEYEFTVDPVEEGMTGFKNKMAWFSFEVLARQVFEGMDFEDGKEDVA